MKKYLRLIKKYLVLSIVLIILEALITSIILLFPGILIDTYYKGNNHILLLLAEYIIAFSLYLLVSYFSNRIADLRRIKFEKAIKIDFFNGVMEKPYREYHLFAPAEYISMQANEITELCQGFLSPLVAVVRSIILLFAFGTSLIIFVDFRIALIILIFSFAVILVPRITAKELSRRNSNYMNEVRNYTEYTDNCYRAFDIYDRACRETIKQKHKQELDNLLAANNFFRKLNSLSMVINGGAVEFVSVITFLIVSMLLVDGKITVGMATIAFNYSTKFMDPIYELNINFSRIKSIEAIKEKLFKIIGNKNDCVKEENNQIQILEIKSKGIRKIIKNRELAFPDMKFCFPNKYLIVGKNGAGKSTFLKLVMGYEELDQGELLIDKGANRTEKIYYIPQNLVIFPATYEENVTMFGTYMKDNLLEYESFFPEDIIKNIKGIDNAQKLSGGEKQIIMLIRALCSEKEVIIMDEPFAAMNSKTIGRVIDKITKLERMLIIVGHNLDEYKDEFDEVIIIQ